MDTQTAWKSDPSGQEAWAVLFWSSGPFQTFHVVTGCYKNEKTLELGVTSYEKTLGKDILGECKSSCLTQAEAKCKLIASFKSMLYIFAIYF